MKSFLKLEVIWKDDDMFELEVTASNGQFTGITQVYEGNYLSKFASSLEGFPKTLDSILQHEAGEVNSYSYFSMKFYVIDRVGHLGVQVLLESKVPTNYRVEQKDRISLEILTEPSLLDTFIKSLRTLAENEEGHAILEGIEK